MAPMDHAPKRRKTNGHRKSRTIDIDFTLRRLFGKSTFRPLQREVISAALEGHDIFLQAATSFGKSLCYQLPAVVDYGITIVVSPLLALMNNQVTSLQAAGISVATINSSTPSSIRQAILEDLRCGHPHTRLLYVTPEFCMTTTFRKNLQTIHEQRELSRIAVDEAHCISEWGHDFRPSFKELNYFKREFPDVPIICVTATATQRVRDDIIDTLGLNRSSLKTFTMTTSRPNIHYEVRFKNDTDDHYENFVRWLRAVYARRALSERRTELEAQSTRLSNVSGIIYVLYRKDCESLAGRLVGDGIGAKPYHAGLTAAEKEDHLQGWVANQEGYDIMVATTAFGMGIDKEDVRFVVHWQMPKSFEGYYQEAGRAGRDQKASVAIMYYAREDRDRIILLQQRDAGKSSNGRSAASEQAVAARNLSLNSLISYCETTTKCRHALIASYFHDPETPPCKYACDWHKDPAGLFAAKERDLCPEEWSE
ncbi:ATP-dependent DNA helicase [Xylona heveae TC161]|uniref:ATP-dependent DNA helicase n=1 Tax=Xylona heveae (strain CBS 132557 / TC161) TaxID=1328760 RepID=A0A165J4P6_XYLHT|nr:ATP-dependent DNA helicase [Xylona heveae TC161]KZF25728.1 ATP-dependent DNA helicase [Xylona heveae TC161]